MELLLLLRLQKYLCVQVLSRSWRHPPGLGAAAVLPHHGAPHRGHSRGARGRVRHLLHLLPAGRVRGAGARQQEERETHRVSCSRHLQHLPDGGADGSERGGGGHNHDRGDQAVLGSPKLAGHPGSPHQ